MRNFLSIFNSLIRQHIPSLWMVSKVVKARYILSYMIFAFWIPPVAMARGGFVQVGPKKYFYQAAYAKHARRFYNFQARSDDVWIIAVPRSGTTLMQEMVWLLENNLDYERAQGEVLIKRAPLLEYVFGESGSISWRSHRTLFRRRCLYWDGELKAELLCKHRDNPTKLKLINQLSTPGYESIKNHKSPRVIKTHFPFSLLPPSVMREQAKIIYVARNPKHVAVSFYYLCRLYCSFGYNNDFACFWDYFESGLGNFKFKCRISNELFSNTLFSKLASILGPRGRRVETASQSKCSIHILRRNEKSEFEFHRIYWGKVPIKSIAILTGFASDCFEGGEIPE